MNSPFITGGPLKSDDILLLAKVLSSETIEEVLTKPSIMDGVRFFFMNRSQAYLNYAAAGIRAHLDETCAWPNLLEKAQQDGGDRGIPWVANVIGSMVKTGMPLKDVLSLPEGQVIWLYVSIGISEGANVDVMSDELEQELRKAIIDDFIENNPQPTETK